jgi:hypothetical protein
VQHPQKKTGTRFSRRRLLAGAAATAFIPNRLLAQTSGRGKIKHLMYIRLSAGFRFPTAFNGDVGEEFNPFGAAPARAPGTEWGMGALLARAPHLAGMPGMALRDLGVKPVNEISNQISVIPCVDHEPLAGSADGNHGTALERWYTGFVDGPVGFFTMINYGLRERMTAATAMGKVALPAFVLGGSGMGRGLGMYAAFRPPVLSGNGFDRFSLKSDSGPPAWAVDMAGKVDQRMRDRQNTALRSGIDAFIETRKATKAYTEIFNSATLKVGNNSDEVVDGISNRQLAAIFGDGNAGRQARMALRLFHYGCPAAYFDQGGYDMHSAEETNLAGQLDEVTRLIGGLEAALKRMMHPTGGTYWDHTLVVFGSEFSRTARGSRFNSARGSDHGGDLATRWMSMPLMGGPVARPGRRLGETRRADLKAAGQVYSYRSVLKTLLDGLGCDHKDFFPADAPFDDLYV